ncbi:MAG: DUF4388 domain-containing protein [Thermoleophilia bacterium]|nr:DUF4388 domain-containing protein [Thermoleophilia bacterium]
MGLSGDLEEFGLAELLQVLVMGKKSGVLMLDRGLTPGGVLVLSDGRLTHAAMEGGAEGEPAFFEMLHISSGLFTFHGGRDEETAGFPTTITRSVEGLLLEAHYGCAHEGS